MYRVLVLLPLLLLASCREKDPWAGDASLPQTISFNQHIRPLLSAECLACHGPEKQAASLRLDLPSGVSSVVSDHSPKKSLLWEKILSNHPVALPEREKALLWRWIKQGTTYESHWASLPLGTSAPAAPPLSASELVSEQEFAFLFNALLGSQPSSEDLAQWVKMQPQRSALIEALMAYPEFASTFRTRLLLLSGTRPVPAGTPFDPYLRWLENEVADPKFSLREFFRNGIAGDLVPDAGEQGQIATAWTRLPTRTDLVTLPRRVAQSYLALDLSRAALPTDLWPDAANTIPQFLPRNPAPFVDSIAIPPFLPLYTPNQITSLDAARLAEDARWLTARDTPTGAETPFKQWLAEEDSAITIPDLAVAMSFDEGALLDGAPNGQARAVSALNLTEGVQSTAVVAPASFTGLPLTSARAFTLSFFLRVPILPPALSPVLLAETAGGAPVGFRFSLSQQELTLQLLNGSQANSLSVTAKTLPTAETWHHFVVSYDGSRSAQGLSLWIDSAPVPLEVTNDQLHGIAKAPQGQLLLRAVPESIAPTSLDELQIYQSVLTEIEVKHLRDGEALFEAVRDEFPREDLLFRYFVRSQFAPARETRQAAIAASERVSTLESLALLVPVAVTPPLPEVRPTLPFLPLPMKSDANRLGLANWLFDDRNPVTPRVVVSRLYQMIYGISLLPQGDELSDSWKLPPNPELLDYLAKDLIRNDWNLRATLRTILLNPPPKVAA